MPDETILTVSPEDTGVRLDIWLARRLPELSRSRIQALMRAGHITLDGSPVKGHRRTRSGDRVRVAVPAPTATGLCPEAIPLDILYQDGDLMVINKPAGLVVHPAARHATGTLVHALLHHCPDLAGIGGQLRPGLAHRLDKDTSGVLVVAKNERALAGVCAQFKAHRVEKDYLALVWGRPRPPADTIASLIGRHRTDRTRMSATPRSGRPALTNYATLEALGPVTLLRIRIATGRMHQIRVHMAHRGHPIVGDARYGLRTPPPLPAPALRQMLHAESLALDHPRTGRRLRFTAPLPPDLEALLAALRPDGRG